MDEPANSPAPQAVPAPDPMEAEKHLRRLAMAELDETRAVLGDTGRDLEAARAQRDGLSAELERVRAQLTAQLVERDTELADTRSSLRTTSEQLSECRATARRDAGHHTATVRALEDHVRRLKTQIQHPWRLLLKWALRRSPYGRKTAGQGN